MRKPRNIIKFLTSDGEVFLCPYCMRHIPGILSKCLECSHDIGRNIDVRTTEQYRKKMGIS